MCEQPSQQVTEKVEALRERLAELESAQGRHEDVAGRLREKVAELERTEEALRGSEARFRSVVQTASEAVITIDTNEQVVFWNAAAESIFGYTEQEMLGESLARIMPSRYHAAHGKAVARATATVRTHLMGKLVHLMGLRKDGREFPLELSVSAWENQAGLFFTGIVRDITARKQAEDELRRLTRQFRLLAAAAKTLHSTLAIPAVMRELVAAGMKLTDAVGGMAGRMGQHDMVFTEYNRGGRIEPVDYTFRWGQAVAGWVIQTCQPYLCNDAATDSHLDQQVRQDQDVRNLVNVPIVGKNGGLLGCFELHNTKDRRDFNEQDLEMLQSLSEMAAIALENALLLEERTATEQALRESEERLQRLTDAAFEGVVVHDEGVILEANDAFWRMFGYSPAELTGENVIGTLLAAESMEAVRRRIAAGDEGPYQAVCVRKDGTKFRGEIRARSIHYHGRTARVAVIRDLRQEP